MSISLTAGQKVPSFPSGRYPGGTVLIYLSFTLFSVVYAAVTTLPPHRMWAAGAGVVYLCAAAASWKGVHERRILRLVVAGTLVVPLLTLVVAGVAQPEVSVVVESAQRFLDDGNPYPEDPRTVEDYNPYSPLMVLFGLPGALLGDGVVTDPRLWFLGFFVTCLVIARTFLPRRTAAQFRPLAFVVASPLVAVTAVTSGIDLPLVGLLVLALAEAWARRGIAAGLLVGCAVALKWTALPVVGVVLVVLWRRRGIRRAVESALVTMVVAASVILVGAHGAVDSFVEHTVMFPLGRGAVVTPAGDSVLGGLLRHVPGGGGVICLLLVATVIAIAVVLIRRELDVFTVATCTAVGFTALFLLAPSSRAGYFVLPVVLVAAGYAYRRDADRRRTARCLHGPGDRQQHEAVGATR
jgi:hypothetical protein